MKVLHPSVGDASTTRRYEGGLHASIYGNKLLRYLRSCHIRLHREHRFIAFFLISVTSVAKGGIWDCTAKLSNRWQSLCSHCEQACIRPYLSALEAPPLAYRSWLECLDAIDLADEQRRVRSSSRSTHLQLSDRYCCSCVRFL